MRETKMSDIKTILDKLDALGEDITEIKVVQAKQAVVLEDHTKRSTSNEEILDVVRKDADERLKSLESIKDKALGAMALLGLLGTLILSAHELGLFK